MELPNKKLLERRLNDAAIVAIVFCIGYFVGRPSSQELRTQYERGVNLMFAYQKFKGYDNLPSFQFRGAAFGWGDPQNESDIDSISHILVGMVIK